MTLLGVLISFRRHYFDYYYAIITPMRDYYYYYYYAMTHYYIIFAFIIITLFSFSLCRATWHYYFYAIIPLHIILHYITFATLLREYYYHYFHHYAHFIIIIWHCHYAEWLMSIISHYLPFRHYYFHYYYELHYYSYLFSLHYYFTPYYFHYTPFSLCYIMKILLCAIYIIICYYCHYTPLLLLIIIIFISLLDVLLRHYDADYHFAMPISIFLRHYDYAISFRILMITWNISDIFIDIFFTFISSFLFLSIIFAMLLRRMTERRARCWRWLLHIYATLLMFTTFRLRFHFHVIHYFITFIFDLLSFHFYALDYITMMRSIIIDITLFFSCANISCVVGCETFSLIILIIIFDYFISHYRHFTLRYFRLCKHYASSHYHFRRHYRYHYAIFIDYFSFHYDIFIFSWNIAADDDWWFTMPRDWCFMMIIMIISIFVRRYDDYCIIFCDIIIIDVNIYRFIMM